jgi:hypothetical protein
MEKIISMQISTEKVFLSMENNGCDRVEYFRKRLYLFP